MYVALSLKQKLWKKSFSNVDNPIRIRNFYIKSLQLSL